ncbi:hypothetical protein Hanom_Chr13g01242981 [Helianthus anomalus]
MDWNYVYRPIMLQIYMLYKSVLEPLGYILLIPHHNRRRSSNRAPFRFPNNEYLITSHIIHILIPVPCP